LQDEYSKRMRKLNDKLSKERHRQKVQAEEDRQRQ
jgi:hypothetical protein